MAQEKVSVSDRIKPEDFSNIAESIIEELKRRRKNRNHLEKHWAEVDRQVAMIPELSHKMNANGTQIPERRWMPEIELPLQAQTLEMLTSDSRRLKFPNNRNWFKARAALTDDYLKRFADAGSVFPGERGMDSRTIINQDNADRIAEGIVAHWHSQYDFRGNVDMIDAEAFCYGAGVGRVRSVRRKIMGFEAKLGNREQTIPVYVPRTIKNVYLDDSQNALMHEGVQLSPSQIQTKTVLLADLIATAKEGGENHKDRDGGYIFAQIMTLTADKQGNVELVELEGDMVIEKSTETIIERNVVVTAAIGKRSGKDTFGLVRYQEGEGFSTYIVHKYHVEGPTNAYPTSPLIKGMPIAKAAAQAMNRLMESAQLKTAPPIGYSRDDPAMTASGGPVIEPHAQWETVEPLTVYDEVGGDPATMFQIFTGFIQLYSDVVGVNAPRLGAQSKSHTTAFAKDVELQQGAVRTVDYVRSSLEGPMTRLLELEYKMGFRDMRSRETIFIEAWNEFITVSKGHLPDVVRFVGIGSGAPAEDAAQAQQRLNSAQFALQLDAAAQQLGAQPSIDVAALIRQVLSTGGWQDVDAVTLEQQPQQAPQEPGAGNGSQVGALTEQDIGGAV